MALVTHFSDFPPPPSTPHVPSASPAVLRAHDTLGVLDAAVSKTPEKNARKGRGSVYGNDDHEAPKSEANGAFKFKLMDFFFFFSPLKFPSREAGWCLNVKAIFDLEIR